MAVIYLDNNATTKVAPQVLEAMLPYFTEHYGNPSSMHTFGGEVGKKIADAREKVAGLLGASPGEIIFTSCGTESDSTAILAAIRSNPDKKHIITSRVEHPAVKNLFERLSKQGYRVTFVPVDREGKLDLDYLYSNLSEDTAIVSIMWANNETGVIFPIREIAKTKRPGNCFPYRCRSSGRKNPDQSISGRDQHALSFRTQAACPQGDWCPLCPKRN